MTTGDLFTLASVTRNAALVVLAALSAMRVRSCRSRRGWVEFQGGSWALRSTVQKGQTRPSRQCGGSPPLPSEPSECWRAVAPLNVVGPTGEQTPSDHLVCTLGRQGNCGRAGLATGHRAFSRFTGWIDEHAEQFGFDPVGQDISPHQFRRTFAVIAAWQSDGHVAVELSSRTPPKWPPTTETTTGSGSKPTSWPSRRPGPLPREYIDDGVPPDLAGPAGPDFRDQTVGGPRHLQPSPARIQSRPGTLMSRLRPPWLSTTAAETAGTAPGMSAMSAV